jgi:hypothetical protein
MNKPHQISTWNDLKLFCNSLTKEQLEANFCANIVDDPRDEEGEYHGVSRFGGGPRIYVMEATDNDVLDENNPYLILDLVDGILKHQVTLSAQQKAFFKAEIYNEKFGGVKPATLASALDTFCLKSAEKEGPADVKFVQSLKDLIEKYGGDTTLESLLS